MKKNQNVLVLNNAFEVHDTVSVQRALKLIVKGKAEGIKYYDDTICSISKTYKKPSVIRLFDYFKFYRKPINYSDDNVLLRDKYTCQYCFKKMHYKSSELTIDHIFPQSLGGTSSWSNCVAACKRCNSLKGNKTLAQLGWKLEKVPSTPSFYQFHYKFSNPLPEWLEYFYI